MGEFDRGLAAEILKIRLMEWVREVQMSRKKSKQELHKNLRNWMERKWMIIL